MIMSYDKYLEYQMILKAENSNADAQADLSLLYPHMRKEPFSQVTAIVCFPLYHISLRKHACSNILKNFTTKN